MVLAVPALVAAWSLVGFYGSLGPALVRRLLGSSFPYAFQIVHVHEGL